jgi:cation-transporting P-type ATPase 13A2
MVVSVSDLVPGDVVVIEPGLIYCDMVILDSDHLLVDESALTGESVPVSKTKLDVAMRHEVFDEAAHKQFSLYAGTSVLETGESGQALVTATGSFTRKGQLLSDILSYQRHTFQFDHEISFVLWLLAMEAVVLVTMVFQFLGGQFIFAWFYSNVSIHLYALILSSLTKDECSPPSLQFILATIFPPLLITVFVVSVGISASRLQKKKITCINSQAILVAGKVNVCCFDKTGTLTNSDMTSVKIDCLGMNEHVQDAVLGIAVCHTIKLRDNGDLVGNEVDRALFLTSNAEIRNEKNHDVVISTKGRDYVTRKQFVFDHNSMTQSVVVEGDDGKAKVFVKGSAEAIRALCTPDSIPSSFDESLLAFSKTGKYVIALASKDFSCSKSYDAVARNDVEVPASFTFCAFLTMENLLKAETRVVMDDLRLGNILLTMITGDNVYTGIRVAREAGICLAECVVLGQLTEKDEIEWTNVDLDVSVDQPCQMFERVDLAITGEAWAMLLVRNPAYAKSIAKYVRVFGRW